MRVLHVYKTSHLESRGGVEEFIFELTSGLKNNFHLNVDVLYLSSATKKSEINGVNYFGSTQLFEVASTGFSFDVIFQFFKLSKKADVIHYHFPWPYMDFLHILLRIKKPTVVTYHSDIVRQERLLGLYRPLKNLFLSSVDRIVSTSPNYLATSDVLKKFSSKVDVIPIGLDKNRYPVLSESRKDYWRTRLGSKFFLFVGALRYYKGLHILLEASRYVNYTIVIVGAGPVEKELKRIAQDRVLNNVLFLGILPDEDKVALLTLCYAVLFPSHLRSEAFGISLLEGAMYGKPMISSEIGTGTSYININGETGIVIPPSDSLELERAMTYLWNNPKTAYEMGIAAERRYRAMFTADKMVKSYVNLYKTLL